MQKLKKALKKLAKVAGKKIPQSTVSAQPAKKAATAKKKTQAVAPKKAAPKKASAGAAAKKPAVKPSGSKPAKAPTQKAKVVAKPDSKSAKKKPQAVPSAPVKAAKSSEKNEKPSKKPAPPVKKAPPVKAEPKVSEPPTDLKAESKARKPSEEPERTAVVAPEVVEEPEVVLTDAEGRRYCRVKDCDQAAAVDSYCRYHYLLFWKNIQNRKKILSEGKLERYIEELTARYPDKYLELLRKDLRSEKDFMAAIQELEIDESGVDTEYEEDAQSYLEEVRGISSEGGGGGARDDEDF